MWRLFVLLSLLLVPVFADTSCTLSGASVACPFSLTPVVYSCNGRNLAVIDVAVTDTSTSYRFNKENSYLTGELGNYSLLNEKEAGSMKLFWSDAPLAFTAVVQMGGVVGSASFAGTATSCPCQISIDSPTATFDPSTGWVDASASLSSPCTEVGSTNRFFAVINGTKLLESQRVLSSFSARSQRSYSGEEIKGYEMMILATGPLAYGVGKVRVLNFNDFSVAAAPAAGAPNQVFQAEVTVKNIGNEPDKYTVTIEAPTSWEVSPLTTAQINPGNQLTQRMFLKPPSTFGQGIDLPVRVTGGNGLTRTTTLHIDAQQSFGFTVGFDPEKTVSVNRTFKIKGYWNVSGTVEGEVRYWFYTDPFLPIDEIDESASVTAGIIPFQLGTALRAACALDKKTSGQAAALADLKGYSYSFSKLVAAGDREKTQKLVAKALPLVYTAANEAANSTIEAVRLWANSNETDSTPVLAKLSDLRSAAIISLNEMTSAAQTEDCTPTTKTKLVMRTSSTWDLSEATVSRDIAITAIGKLKVALEPSELSIAPGSSAVAELVVNNIADQKQTIFVQNSASVFDIQTSAAAIEIGPGQVGKIKITVNVPEDSTINGDTIDFFVASGKSLETVSLAVTVDRPKFRVQNQNSYELTSADGQFEIQLENAADVATTFSLELEGTGISLDSSSIELEPGETKSVWINVDFPALPAVQDAVLTIHSPLTSEVASFSVSKKETVVNDTTPSPPPTYEKSSPIQILVLLLLAGVAIFVFLRSKKKPPEPPPKKEDKSDKSVFGGRSLEEIKKMGTKGEENIWKKY